MRTSYFFPRLVELRANILVSAFFRWPFGYRPNVHKFSNTVSFNYDDWMTTGIVAGRDSNLGPSGGRQAFYHLAPTRFRRTCEEEDDTKGERISPIRSFQSRIQFA